MSRRIMRYRSLYEVTVTLGTDRLRPFLFQVLQLEKSPRKASVKEKELILERVREPLIKLLKLWGYSVKEFSLRTRLVRSDTPQAVDEENLAGETSGVLLFLGQSE